jgi:hypothetical protein
MKEFNAEPFPVSSKRFQKKTACTAYIQDRSPLVKRFRQQLPSHTKIFADSAMFLG